MGMTSRCRHTHHIPVGALDACTRCDRVRVSAQWSVTGTASRWYAASPDEAAVVAEARAQLGAALPRRDAGRPVLPPGRRRDVELRVRLRPGEVAALDALATRYGLDRSETVRRALMAAGADLPMRAYMGPAWITDDGVTRPDAP